LIAVIDEKPAFLSRGQLAARLGVNPETIRFYEKTGLLPAPKRRSNGYRVYDERDLLKLQLVRMARGFGFSQREITAFLAELDAGAPGFTEIECAVRKRIAEIDLEVEGLRRQQAELEGLLLGLRESACSVKRELFSID
jgi:DNA-binding transcriptional MerR regulator